MIRLVSLDKIDYCYNEMLCYPIVIDSKKTIPRCTVLNDNHINLIKELSTIFKSKYAIVSNEKAIKESELRDFILFNANLCAKESMEEINKNYAGILNEGNVYQNIEAIIKNSFIDLNEDYVIQLITTPLIFKKSLNLAVLSLYFALKVNLSVRELYDVASACLLNDINICMNNIGLKDINKENFLMNYLNQNSSYSLICNDEHLSTNTKRLVKYWKIKNTESVYISEEGKLIFKDPTIEVIQVSNELLQYGSDVGDLVNIYNTYNYSSLRPILVHVIKTLEIEKTSIDKKSNRFMNKIKNIVSSFFGTVSL